MVAALGSIGIDGSSLLEVGAGSGTAIAAMFDRGVATAVGIEISANYEATARGLLAERGVASAVDWRTGDFVELAGDLPDRDIVFLNRVVCCYPFMDAMVDTATGKARRLVAMSYPRRRSLVWLFMKVTNGWMRLNRNSFRVFLHDPGRVEERVAQAGFSEIASGTTAAWHWKVWEREGHDRA